ARRQRDRRIGAVFKLDGHEDHLVIADIFQIVNCEITLAYSAVPYLVGLVGPFKPDDLHWVWLLQRTGTRLGLFRGRTRTWVVKLSLIRLSEPRLEVFIGASVG